jgi:hypothetical protein
MAVALNNEAKAVVLHLVKLVRSGRDLRPLGRNAALIDVLTHLASFSLRLRGFLRRFGGLCSSGWLGFAGRFKAGFESVH